MRFLPKKHKLRAATAVRRMPRGAMEGYAPEQEISFAKAIVVVIVLHVVAVGGIWAFSSLKAHNAATSDSATRHSAAAALMNAAGTNDAQDDSEKPADADAQARLQPRQLVSDPGVANDAKPAEPQVKPPVAANTTAPVKDTGTPTTYTVAKGDNPVAIAKRFHVSYDELLKINKITDPKKLQIGQKLKIPAKKTQ